MFNLIGFVRRICYQSTSEGITGIYRRVKKRKYFPRLDALLFDIPQYMRMEPEGRPEIWIITAISVVIHLG
jgi:hypothetical protein